MMLIMMMHNDGTDADYTMSVNDPKVEAQTEEKIVCKKE